MSQAIRQSVTFDARPGVIFEALMASRRHSAFTGAPAKISRKAGGAFSCYGGYITGWNVEIIRNKTIVQAWRGKDWPKGAWSLATFDLAAAKGGKTKLSFSQIGVPTSKVKGITAGWKSSYWTPLKAHLKTERARAAKRRRPAAARARKK